MTTQVLSAVVAVLVAFIGGYLTWRTSKRITSGTIKTTEAATLWQESTLMRDDLRTEVIGLRAQLAEAIVKITDLLHQIEASNAATANAREETRLSRAETAQLREEIARTHSEVKSVLSEVKTGNALTMGVLADNAESRRIALILPADRTHAETEHIDQLGVQSDGPSRSKEKRDE